jgi:hypothetical protein
MAKIFETKILLGVEPGMQPEMQPDLGTNRLTE